MSESESIIMLDSISLSNLGAWMLWGEINEESSFRACEYLLKANMVLGSDDTLTMFINSPGGSVTEGWAIIDLMESSHVNIQTVAVGEIASMGVSIFVAGTRGKRIMTPKTNVMTHQFAAGFFGKAHELMAARKIHDTIDRQTVDHFIRHTKMNEKQIRDILMGPSDKWLEPKECLKYGLCDEIRDPWDESLAPSAKQKTKRPSRAKKTAAPNECID